MNSSPLNDLRKKYVPTSYQFSVLYDTLWMLSLHFHPDDTSMWVGWNANVFQRKKFFRTYGIYRRLSYLQHGCSSNHEDSPKDSRER